MDIKDFDKLKEQLDLLDWPSVYYFKFIVPNESDKVARVGNLFGDTAEMNLQPSKNNNYISVSAKEMMLTSESVIEIYQKASTIEGIISL